MLLKKTGWFLASHEDGRDISNPLAIMEDIKHQRVGMNTSKSARLGYLMWAGELVWWPPTGAPCMNIPGGDGERWSGRWRQGRQEAPGEHRLGCLTISGWANGKGDIRCDKELKHRSVINASQNGFMENRSCQRNVISFFDEITHLVDKSDCVEVIDSSKAVSAARADTLINIYRGKLSITSTLNGWRAG